MQPHRLYVPGLAISLAISSVCVAGTKRPTSAADTTPSPLPDAALAPWPRSPALHQSLRLDLDITPDDGSLHVALEVLLAVRVDPQTDERVVAAKVVEVSELQLQGEFDPSTMGATLAQR